MVTSSEPYKLTHTTTSRGFGVKSEILHIIYWTHYVCSIVEDCYRDRMYACCVGIETPRLREKLKLLVFMLALTDARLAQNSSQQLPVATLSNGEGK